MRLSKTITAGNCEITVYEVTGGDFLSLLKRGVDIETMAPADLMETIIPMVCDRSVDEISQYGMSTLLDAWDAVMEVNPAFFELARRTGLTEMAQEKIDAIRQMLLTIWNEVSAGLSGGGTSMPQDME